MRNETDLIRKAAAGDREAFDELLLPHTQRAYRTACLITHNPDLAADAVQDALLRAYRALGNLRPGSTFSPWFCRIVVHEAIKQCNRQRRIRYFTLDSPPEMWPDFLVAPAGETPEAALQVQEERRRLWQAVAALPPAHRAVIVLRYFNQYSEPEVADLLGIPLGTVKSRSFHARAALERVLQDPGARSPLHPVTEGGTMDD